MREDICPRVLNATQLVTLSVKLPDGSIKQRKLTIRRSATFTWNRLIRASFITIGAMCALYASPAS